MAWIILPIAMVGLLMFGGMKLPYLVVLGTILILIFKGPGFFK